MDAKAPVASPTFTGTVTGPTINASTALQIGGVAVTATAAELNKMDGVTVSASDINSVTTKAPIDGATFTGTTTIPTLSIGGTSVSGIGTSANNLVKLDGSGALPAVSGANLTGLSSSGNLFTAPADGTVTDGDMLILRSDGDVAKVAVESTVFPTDTSNTAVNVEYTSSVSYTSLERVKVAVNKADPTKFAVIGKTDNGNGYIAAGTVSNGAITMTAGRIFHTDFFEGDVCHIEGDYWCVGFRSSNEYGRMRTWNASTDSVGALYTFTTNSTYRVALDSPKSGGTDDHLIALIWMDNNDGNEGHMLVATHDGSGGLGDTTSSYHHEWTGTSAINGQNDLFFEHVNGQTQGIIAYYDEPNTVNKVMPFRYNSGTPTFGTAVTTGVRARSTGLGFRNCSIAYNENQSGVFVVAIVANSTNYLHVIPFTFSEGSSGNLPSNITKGTAIVGNEDLGETSCDVFLSGNSTNIGGTIFYNGYSNKVQVQPFSLSSNVLTAGTTQDIATGGNDNDRWKSTAAVDANNNFEFYGVYSDGTDQFIESFTLGRTVSTTNLNTQPFVGVAQNSATNGQTVTVMTKGGIDDAQSSLTIGSTYYIQDNGTLGTSAGSVSTVAGIALTSSTLLIGG